ncbi:MAG: hypothetical protein ACLQKA_03380 [Bryobacteraceae bacterium]
MSILAALAIIAGLVAVLICNDLIRLLGRSESALVNIEVLLKMRHDLVPGLLNAVRVHAGD